MPRQINKDSLSSNILTILLQKSPDLVSTLGQLYKDYKKFKSEISIVNLARREYYQRLYRLRQKGYISKKGWGKNTNYELTKQGFQLAASLLTEKIKLPIAKSWDKKWRLLCFDIPEAKRRERAFLRNFLYRNGFRKYQDSIWITPYNILSNIQKVITDANLRSFICTITAIQITKQKHFKKIFNL